MSVTIKGERDLKPVTRKQAVAAILEMFDRWVGCEKGSSEMWSAFCEDMKLIPEWDGKAGTEVAPPSPEEFLLALGVVPQEMVNVKGYNPGVVFPAEMCEAYGVPRPTRKRARP
jgi:hypothetical protein